MPGFPINAVVKSHIGYCSSQTQESYTLYDNGLVKNFVQTNCLVNPIKMPWSLGVCSCNIAPSLPVFPWLEFPSQLPVAQMNAVRQFAAFFQKPYDKISARAPRASLEHLGQPAQALLCNMVVPWGLGGCSKKVGEEWSRLSRGRCELVVCLPGQGFQPGMRNQRCQGNHAYTDEIMHLWWC